VCQHRSEGHITDALDVRGGRVELVVDDNTTPLVLFYTNGLEVQSISVRPSSNSNEADVGFDLNKV
jgi:hypothetical protein